ncbi:hypothetical protein SCAR479_11883 [Seiridium cardinale]|uniref:Cytochrome P450 n=1 Tax=Seiridium cardinale TaxID=138064 RepID=A0ABR2XCA7_9PEZI
MAIFQMPPVDLSSWTAQWLAFALGSVLHIFLFRVGEWNTSTTKIIATFLAANLASILALPHYFPTIYPSHTTAVSTTASLGLSLILGIWSSMLIYRAVFHPLNRFPGPFWARLSNLYVTSLTAKNLHLYEEIQKLHNKYGEVVRIGPSELSIITPSATSAILGNKSPCVKGPFYDIIHPVISLQMTRNKEDHAVRRKVWDRAFSAKALREYEPRVQKYTDQLIEQLDKQKGKSLDTTAWFNFYSFDVMGDLAWGKSLNMLRDGTVHYFMKALHADMTNVGLFSHLVWLFPLFKAIPILNSENKKYWRWIHQQVTERRSMKPDRPDVFSPLLEAYEKNETPTRQNELDLLGDANLIAVAGSDTTAASLTCLFFELARNPNALELLQQEIDEFYQQINPIDGQALSKLEYLDAVINETLRLHPPVPSGVQRKAPQEGLTIDDIYIPGNTIVKVPTHTVFRDARFFPHPDDFIPERWTTQKELNNGGSVYFPFSAGRSSCIGKQLGLLEVRHVTARILRDYDISFMPTYDPETFLKGKRDTFTLSLAPLQLVFTRRQVILAQIAITHKANSNVSEIRHLDRQQELSLLASFSSLIGPATDE